MVLDLLDVPDGATLEGAKVPRYTRRPLAPPFTVSPTGALRLPQMTPAQGFQLGLEKDTPRFFPAPGVVLRALGERTFRAEVGPSAFTFRIVDDSVPPLRWPDALDAEVRALAPGTAGLEVLADALLERGHRLGERLRALPSSLTNEDWEGDLRHLEAEGRADFTWSRGVVTHAVLRGLEGLDRLGAHVLTHLTQQLHLVAWRDEAPTVESMAAALDALFGPRLPWLGRLTVHGLKGPVGEGLQRLVRKGRWTDAVPDGCVVETPTTKALALRTASRVDAVPDKGFMQVGEGVPLCFVRRRHGVAELTVTRPSFELAGVVRARGGGRGPGEGSPWVVALKPGDTFVVDGRTYTLDAG